VAVGAGVAVGVGVGVGAGPLKAATRCARQKISSSKRLLLATTGRTLLSIIPAVIGPLSGRLTCANGMHPRPTGSEQSPEIRAASKACRSGN
jgi:hypothetical protein